MSDVEDVRVRFEEQWLRLRRSLESETGAEPRWSARWVMPVAAVLLGFWAGNAVRRSRRRGRDHLRDRRAGCE